MFRRVNEKDVLKELGNVLLQAIINRQFPTNDADTKISGGSVSLSSAAMNIMKDKNAEFFKLITNMIRVCQMEEKDAKLTRINYAHP